MFLLDTDICSYVIRGQNPELLTRFYAVRPDKLAISTITQAELLYGLASATKKQRTKLNERQLFEFLSLVNIRNWDNLAAETYAQVRVGLEKKGKPSGAMDMLIAAHALSLGATLVTNNSKHFKSVPKLKLTNWL